jgi:hypothetical protein
MRLKHHDCDSYVADSNRHYQFGTRGSEVRILSYSEPIYWVTQEVTHKKR